MVNSIIRRSSSIVQPSRSISVLPHTHFLDVDEGMMKGAA